MQKRDFELNGKLYQLLLPPVTISLPLSNRAVTVLGPVAGLFSDLRTIVDPDSPREAKLAAVLQKLGAVLAQLDPVAANTLMMDAVNASGLCCDGKPVTGLNFERHFGEYRGEVYQVMTWCLWECVCDFFPQLGTFTQILKTGAAEVFRSQTAGQTTTG